MDKLNIKKRRVMMYFIEATQELILNEGIENLSIKKSQIQQAIIQQLFIIILKT